MAISAVFLKPIDGRKHHKHHKTGAMVHVKPVLNNPKVQQKYILNKILEEINK